MRLRWVGEYHKSKLEEFWPLQEAWAMEVLEKQNQILSQNYSELALLHISNLSTLHLVDKLKWLRLNSSWITHMGLQRIWMLKGLRVLQIVQCTELEDVPESLGNFIHLVELEVLECHNLKSLHDNIDKLEQLKRLVIGSREISTIPSGIGRLPRLEYLDVEDCDFLKGPFDFAPTMVELQVLRLSFIPENLSPSLHLEVLHLTNQLFLDEFPSDLFNDKLTRLEELHIWGYRGLLKYLPNLFGNLVNLRDLTLSDHEELVELPKAIKELSKLQSSALDHCYKLASLPESLGDLSELSLIWECSDVEKLIGKRQAKSPFEKS